MFIRLDFICLCIDDILCLRDHILCIYVFMMFYVYQIRLYVLMDIKAYVCYYVMFIIFMCYIQIVFNIELLMKRKQYFVSYFAQDGRVVTVLLELELIA